MSSRKVLLDECVDRGLVSEITGHDVKTAPDVGWASLKNGELLSRALAEFDVFVTTDQNLMFQQNLPKFDIAVIVLAGKTNRLRDLGAVCEQLLESVGINGEVCHISPGERARVTRTEKARRPRRAFSVSWSTRLFAVFYFRSSRLT